MKKHYPPGAIQTVEEFRNLLTYIEANTKFKIWAVGNYQEDDECPLNAIYLTSLTKVLGPDDGLTAAPVQWGNNKDLGWIDIERRILDPAETGMFLFTNYWLAYGYKIKEDNKRTAPTI